MSDELFPMSLVAPIIEALERNLPDHDVVARMLGSSEGADTIGVFPVTWRPIENTKEIGAFLGGGSLKMVEPTIQAYTVRIQNLRIDADEVQGRSAFNVTCKKIKAILYRDPTLQLSLQSLSDELFGVIERMKQYDITKQDYLSANLGMGMYYLGTTEITFQTESTPTS